MSETYTVERSIEIAAPPDRVYRHLIDFRNWAAWSPWEGLDTQMDKTFDGADSGVGATYSWSGNRKVGQGRMEIVGADEPAKVDIDLEFIKPFKANNRTAFSLAPTDGGTAVTWSMTGPVTFLLRIIGLFRSMDKMVGPDYEKGLAQLKSVVESESGT